MASKSNSINKVFTVPKHLFYFSYLFSIVAISVMGPYNQPIHVKKEIIAITAIVDPLMIQGISGFILLVLGYYWMKNDYQKYKDHNDLEVFSDLTMFFLIFLFIGLDLGFGDHIAEIFFKVPVIENPMPEPFFTKWISSLFHRSSPLKNNSAPSGFVLRQSLIFLGGFFITNQNDLRISKLKKTVVKLVFTITLVIISISRIVRLAHTPFDVFLAFSFGTIIFWSIVSITHYISNLNVSKEWESSFTLFTSIIISLFLFISRNPGSWMIFIFTFVIFSWLFTVILRVKYPNFQNEEID